MKRFLSGAILILLFLISASSFVFAQTPTPGLGFDFPKAYQDFLFTYDNYTNAETSYQLARAVYLQSKTLAAKSKAQEETYKFLQARDEVIKTYLTMLRQRVAESVGISQDVKTVLFSKIDIEVGWYGVHKDKISSAATLEDLTRDSDEAKDRYRDITQSVVYQILTDISVGKEYFLRQKQRSIIDDLNKKLIDIRTSGDFQTDQMERDLLEVENRQARSIAKEDEVKKMLTDLEKATVGSENIYNQIVFRMGESLQYLKESNTYLRQIVQKIKNS
jgi:hypothetical protein